MQAFVKRHPLPVINNENYEEQVFTHKSVNGLPAGQLYEDEAGVDNERFALLGDSVIDLIVLEKLEEELPLSRRGDLDYKRSLLICKDRVEQWSLAYGLPDQLRVHRAQKLVIPGNQNARVQVFQAYVGALFKESGYDLVKGWLEFVVEEALKEIQSIETAEGVDDLDDAFCNMSIGGAKNAASPLSGTGSSKRPSPPPPPPSPPPVAAPPTPRRKSTGSSQTSAPKAPSPASSSSNKAPLMALNELASQKQIKLIWNEERQGESHEPVFKFTVTFQGYREIMGKGTGGSKLIAKHQAAAEALKRLHAL